MCMRLDVKSCIGTKQSDNETVVYVILLTRIDMVRNHNLSFYPMISIVTQEGGLCVPKSQR